MTAPTRGVPTPREVADALGLTDGTWHAENLEDLRAALAAATGDEPPTRGARRDDGQTLRRVRDYLASADPILDDARSATTAGEHETAVGHRLDAALLIGAALARGVGQCADAGHRIADSLAQLAHVHRARPATTRSQVEQAVAGAVHVASEAAAAVDAVMDILPTPEETDR